MKVGIDLGTTFSAIAKVDSNNVPQIIPNLDGGRTTPSVVMFEGSDVCVGEQAKNNSIADPLNVCQFVKRQMGQPMYTFENEDGDTFKAEEISAIILKSLVSAAETTTGETVTGAVITVPAYFSDAQRKATQDAGEIAGLNVLAVINEPTAAAIAYCQGDKDIYKQNVLVFDLGGGTFDVTVMSVNGNSVDILATGGHKNIGGFDFDNVIINMVCEKFEEDHDMDLYDDDTTMQDLRVKAENAKKSLSTRNKVNISIMSQGKALKMEITKDEFNSGIQKIIRDIEVIMEMAIDDAKLAWSDLDKIILVGGSTRVPAIQEMILTMTGITPSHDVHPDEAVALGAACYAHSLAPDANGEAKTPMVHVRDVNAHSIGVVSNNEEGIPSNNIIIPRNTRIPIWKSVQVYTASENQCRLDLEVTEGEDLDLDYVNIIGRAEIHINPVPLSTPVRLDVSCDKNGLIQISVFHGETGEKWGEMEVNRSANLTNDEIETKKERMDELEIE